MAKLVAAIMCDQVIRDEGTKKFTLVGVFDRIAAAVVPATRSQIGLYFKVVELPAEKLDASLTLVKVANGETVEKPKTFQVESTGSVQLAVNRIGQVFQEFGRYAFQLEIAGAIVGMVEFEVVPMESQTGEA